MRRITMLAVVVAALALPAIAAPPAGAADPPAPPVIWSASSAGANEQGIVSGQAAPEKREGTIVALAMADGAGACPRAMSGDGITRFSAVTATFPMSSVTHFQGSSSVLSAGMWVYGTTTIDGVTSEVGECVRVKPGWADEVRVESVRRTAITVGFAPSLGTTSVQLWAMGPRYDPVQVWESGPESPITATGLVPGTVYRFQLVLFNDLAGRQDSGAPVTTMTPPFDSLRQLADRQFVDFAGRAATSTEQYEWADAITDAPVADQPATIYGRIDAMVDHPNWAPVQSPVTRLYLAYFQRQPDTGGLAHWSAKRRTGVRAAAISDQFARSSEFTRRYGALSDQAFVELVYRNVLGRSGDAGGVGYWTRQLQTRAKTRGQVMLGFSESSEFVRKTAVRVELVNVVSGMLRRVPTQAEVQIWAPYGATTLDATGLIAEIFASDAYDDRIG